MREKAVKLSHFFYPEFSYIHEMKNPALIQSERGLKILFQNNPKAKQY